MKTSIFLAILGLLFFMSFTPMQWLRAATVPEHSISVRLTDSPAHYSALYVEILEIDVYGENQGWINISNQRHYVNILSLCNGTEVELANYLYPKEDTYTKLMIRFGNENELYLYGDAEAGDQVASVMKTMVWRGPREIYIPIYCEVPSDDPGEILLDFNVASSVVEEGDEYILQPVITCMDNIHTGICGNVGGVNRAVVIIANEENTYSTYINPLGDFLVRGMQPGTYDVTIIPNYISFDEKMHETIHVYDVSITEDQILQLENALP